MAEHGNGERWDINGSDGVEFARRITVADATGFFTKGLVIEPGTKALIVEDGVRCGEVPPGAYVLKSFAEHLERWSRKQATAILTRMEDLRLAETFPGTDSDPGFPTSENLFVDVSLSLTVQMHDVERFLHNYMGVRNVITEDQLRNDMRPLIRQALWSAIRGLSIRDLGTPDAARTLENSIGRELEASFSRYGLKFIEIQTVSIRHEKFDELEQHQGEIWLWKEGLQQQQDINQLYSNEELQRIKNLERDNELKLLAYEVQSDFGEGVITSKTRRIAILNKIREVTQQGHMDKLTSRDEMKQFLLERDKDRLIREEEWDQVLENYEQDKEDRSQLRQHILSVLERKREQEIFELDSENRHQRRLQQLGSELEIAERAKATGNAEHETALQELRNKAIRDHEQATADLKLRFIGINQENDLTRKDEWEQAVHMIRIKTLEYDFESRVRDDEARRSREEAEWALSVKVRKRESKLDAVERLTEINTKADSEEREQRHGHDEATRRTRSTMPPEALIADADPENAAILGGVEKAKVEAEAEKARAEAEAAQAESNKTKEMYERMLDSAKESQQVMKDFASQAIEAGRPSAAAPPTPSAPEAAADGDAATWLVNINGQQTGPFPLTTLQEWAKTGRLSPDAHVWSSSLGPEWTKASQAAELAGHFPPPPPQPADPQQ